MQDNGVAENPKFSRPTLKVLKFHIYSFTPYLIGWTDNDGIYDPIGRQIPGTNSEGITNPHPPPPKYYVSHSLSD